MAATMPITIMTWQEGKAIGDYDQQIAKALFAAAGRQLQPGRTGSARLWGTLDAYFTDQSSFATRIRHGVPPACPYAVAPGSAVWPALADDADLLIRLPGTKGSEGVLALNDWLKAHGIAYNTSPTNPNASAGDRATYGLRGHKAWAIQLKDKQFQPGPPELDCTTYVNLALSIYLQGHAHEAPYDAATPFGATSGFHCARDRYKLPLVPSERPDKVFFTAEQIDDKTEAGKMYALELGGGRGGGVLHMALLFNGRVYEYAPTLDFNESSLEDFVDRFAGRGLFFYLFGPK